MNQDLKKVYTCPMHPEVRQNKPGLCPDCGMNLLPEKDKGGDKRAGHPGHGRSESGFDKHAGHHTNIFRNKFWISLVLSLPVVLYSGIVPELAKWSPPQFPGSSYVPFVLASVIFFYGGWVFLASAWRELKARLPGMMTLISLAIITAYAWSLYVVFVGHGKDLFWELSTLIVVMLLGHWLEMRAVTGAQGALAELSKLLPDTAEVMRGDKTETVPLAQLKEGDIVLIRPGAKVPADGVVVRGESEVNESLATGESRPVKKTTGSEIIAGTINGDGSLEAKITKIGEKTFLAGVMRLVAEAQASKSHLQILSDRAAYYLTIIAVVVGGTTLASWLAAQAGAEFAIQRMVAVLVITCPHALGLAVPLVASISTTKAAKNGFLVKQRLALEAARGISTIVFDKTGTLTLGEYGVSSVFPMAGLGEKEILALAASVDAYSEHPVSRAIIKRAEEAGATVRKAEDFRRLSGKGVSGRLDGAEIMAGGESILDGRQVELPPEAKTEAAAGRTLIYVLKDGSLVGVISLGDIIRPESKESVRELKEMGVKVAMLTGDSEEVAVWAAKELGIDEYFARVLPGEKAEKVKLLQAQGGRVAMVGDGINDAPALTQADLGIAIGAGTNVAIESAGIILVKNDPRDIPKVIRLSRMTYRKMLQNLFWATGYNAVAIPLAAGVLAFRGIWLQPAAAAILMSLSTVIVAANALLLRRARL